MTAPIQAETPRIGTADAKAIGRVGRAVLIVAVLWGVSGQANCRLVDALALESGYGVAPIAIGMAVAFGGFHLLLVFDALDAVLTHFILAASCTDNADGTVTDSATGRMWQQAGDAPRRTVLKEAIGVILLHPILIFFHAIWKGGEAVGCLRHHDHRI
jgi:hypothetical protein